MANKVFVVPAKEGLIVTNPDGSTLKAKGDWINKDDPYWQRRFLDEEIVEKQESLKTTEKTVTDSEELDATENNTKTSKKGK